MLKIPLLRLLIEPQCEIMNSSKIVTVGWPPIGEPKVTSTSVFDSERLLVVETNPLLYLKLQC